MTQSLYQEHFGIRENPFSIIPDPHYLFMSQRHQDALAHLLYGVGKSGGFVLLTGEVGTGKTTICRALVEQLPGNVDLALILNPRLSEPELMAAICDELHIPYPLGTKSIKDFFDFMNRYLLDAHARGRNPVLMIDEAQNLSPDVLELVRLLTNLETTEKKLLQIILVGQPELGAMLAKPEMRQIAQRITARYHLTPLGLMETRNYIAHRLGVVGLDGRVFTPGAVKVVFKAARGIPRLINSVCDRALLAAYVEGKKQVSTTLAKRAAAEVLGAAVLNDGRTVWGTLALALALTGLLLWVGLHPAGAPLKDKAVALISPLLPAQTSGAPALPSPPEPAPQTVAVEPPPVLNAEETLRESPPAPTPEPAPEATPAPMPAQPVEAQPVEAQPAAPQAATAEPAPAAPQTAATESAPAQPGPAQAETKPAGEDVSNPQGTVLDELVQNGTPDRAFDTLFSLWGQSYMKLEGPTPCDKANAAGLSCLQGETNLEGLKAMNRPAAVSMVMPDGEHVYGVISAIDEGSAGLSVRIEFEGRPLTLSDSAFTLRWPGDFLVVWKPNPKIQRHLVFGQTGTDVVELRRLLALAGYADAPKDKDGAGSAFFGPALKEKLLAFQKDNGLRADGIAGPETLMRITGRAGLTTLPPVYAGTGNR